MAFCTGSRVYGIPREDSDLDLVILVSTYDFQLLTELSDNYKTDEQYDGSNARSLKFGRLNIIATIDENVYAAWKVGTEHCRRNSRWDSRVSREVAKSVILTMLQQIKQPDLSKVGNLEEEITDGRVEGEDYVNLG